MFEICIAQVPPTHSSSTQLAGKTNFKNHNTSGFMAWYWFFSLQWPTCTASLQKAQSILPQKNTKTVSKNTLWSWSHRGQIWGKLYCHSATQKLPVSFWFPTQGHWSVCFSEEFTNALHFLQACWPAISLFKHNPVTSYRSIQNIRAIRSRQSSLSWSSEHQLDEDF